MMICRRRMTFGLGAVLLAGRPGRAQDQQRTVRILVGIAPGGLPDAAARILARGIGETFGRKVVVENRPGAGGNFAAKAVASAEPDGGTLLITGNNHAVNPTLLPNPGFDYDRDFAPISMVVQANMMLVASPAFPASDLQGLIALAGRAPGTVRFAVPPIGTPNHLGAELLARLAGVQFSQIPYPGLAPALPDLMSDRVQLAIGAIPSVLPHVAAGKLKAIAVTRRVRTPLAPDIPTIAESGLRDYEIGAWIGLLAPGRMPAEVAEQLSAETRQVLALDNVRREFELQGAEATSTTPEGFRVFIRRETSKWSPMLARSLPAGR